MIGIIIVIVLLTFCQLAKAPREAEQAGTQPRLAAVVDRHGLKPAPQALHDDQSQVAAVAHSLRRLHAAKCSYSAAHTEARQAQRWLAQTLRLLAILCSSLIGSRLALIRSEPVCGGTESQLGQDDHQGKLSCSHMQSLCKCMYVPGRIIERTRGGRGRAQRSSGPA